MDESPVSARQLDVDDVPAPGVLPVRYQVKAGALCLPFANARHSHEIDAFKTQKLPDRMTLVCGVVGSAHNYVEHPLVSAERLARAVRAVGDRERVMAGTDCGFGTIVGNSQVSEDVVWPSLRRCATVRRSLASGRGVEEAARVTKARSAVADLPVGAPKLAKGVQFANKFANLFEKRALYFCSNRHPSLCLVLAA